MVVGGEEEGGQDVPVHDGVGGRSAAGECVVVLLAEKGCSWVVEESKRRWAVVWCVGGVWVVEEVGGCWG